MHAGVFNRSKSNPNLLLKKSPPPKKKKQSLRVQDDIPWTKRRREVQLLQNLFCCVGLEVVCKVGQAVRMVTRGGTWNGPYRNGLKINKWVCLGWTKLYLYQHIPISSMYGIFTSTCTIKIKHPMYRQISHSHGLAFQMPELSSEFHGAKV